MQQLERQSLVAYVLCLAAVPAGILGHLALLDIYHGEADVRLEWRIVQAAALIVAAAVVTALRALHTALQLAGEEPASNRAV